MRSDSDFIQALRERGSKATPQRLIIHQALQGDTSHPSAEAVFERVRSLMPTVSLTTVYSTLNELVAMGELKRFEVNGVSHFDPDTEPHAEAVCLGCSAIVDVDRQGMVNMPRIPGFEIVGQTQTFYGYCARCRAARRQQSQQA